MKIDGKTADEWVESNSILVIEVEGEREKIHEEHRRRDEELRELVPKWPPRATKENSKIVTPYEVVVRADSEVVADGVDKATVEMETTAEEAREIKLLIDGGEIGTYLISPDQTISESIATTTTQEAIEVDAVGEGEFKDGVTIDVIQQ